MMWLDANLPAGRTCTLLAHSTHAVVFSEHVFGDYPPGGAPRDEESWLNEGLAHLAEASHGYGWNNLDHRIAAFLNAPEASPLVVHDAYAAGLWRGRGHRGAAFLFVRHCARRHGPDLPRRLTQSGLCGAANLEAATQTPFHELFRRWTVDLVSDEPLVRGPWASAPRRAAPMSCRWRRRAGTFDPEDRGGLHPLHSPAVRDRG
jgi:hypothetical protein